MYFSKAPVLTARLHGISPDEHSGDIFVGSKSNFMIFLQKIYSARGGG
jgi:hypothetical protein